MSGFSETKQCFNCGELELNVYSDWKPYDYVMSECYACGIFTTSKIKQMTLDELNDMRDNLDMKPIKKLPKVNVDSNGYLLERSK